MTDAFNDAKEKGMPDINNLTDGATDYYNCFASVINLLSGIGLTGSRAKDVYDPDQAQTIFYTNYKQTVEPSVGASAMVFGNEYGLQHAAIYMGTESKGNIQTFSKNGFN